MKRLLIALAVLCCCSAASAAEPLLEITIRIHWPTWATWQRPAGYKDPLVKALEADRELYDSSVKACPSPGVSAHECTSYHGYPIETDSKGFKYFIDKDGKCGARGNRVYVDGSDWVGGPG